MTMTKMQTKPAQVEGEDSQRITTPPVDILETEQEIWVFADMPGVRGEDVDVRFENGELTVHGRRSPAHADKPQARWEYAPASYFRSFRVTEKIAVDKIEAEVKHGVLTLKLPKVEAAKPRRITVKNV
jgi:HSP20 family protein